MKMLFFWNSVYASQVAAFVCPFHRKSTCNSPDNLFAIQLGVKCKGKVSLLCFPRNFAVVEMICEKRPVILQSRILPVLGLDV